MSNKKKAVLFVGADVAADSDLESFPISWEDHSFVAHSMSADVAASSELASIRWCGEIETPDAWTATTAARSWQIVCGGEFGPSSGACCCG